MGDILSNWAANAALDVVLPKNAFLGLHQSDPTPAANTGSEVGGGGYERQPIKFADAGNRVKVSISAQTFPGMPACTVKYLAVWTAVGGGHMTFAKELDDPIEVEESGQFLVAAGDIAMSF